MIWKKAEIFVDDSNFIVRYFSFRLTTTLPKFVVTGLVPVIMQKLF